MRIEFMNGVSVHRMHRDSVLTELVAAFGYETDAIAFAKARMDSDANMDQHDSEYIVCNHSLARIVIVKGASNQAQEPDMTTPEDRFRDELIDLVRKHIKACNVIVPVMDEISSAVENDEFEGSYR
jgi:hypothetical protein